MAITSRPTFVTRKPRIIAAAVAAIILTPTLSPSAADLVAGLEVSPREASGWKLPQRLSEISGLTATGDGRVFAHGDENAIIYQLDPRAGKIVKAFALGDVTVRADFEGIALAKGKVYLVTSDGTIYEAPEGGDGERVLFNTYGTGVGRKCEIEGLAYEKSTGDLLLACKTARVPELAGHLVVFRWNIEARALSETPALLVPMDQIRALRGVGSLHPTGIEVLTGSGNYLLIAAKERLILELTRSGDVVAIRDLTPELHIQPEGVTMLPGGVLLIADEGGRGRGRLTLYETPRSKP